ncbi:MAG: redoxin family protein [Flavobacteriales bacterium]|jgi:thiol-disulfide isomerase/thioredoxin|nr:redoxin family protein [Flavobacteriales bacterium]MBT5089855.1 redoxin family protein [Flavobacteriales bacterium]MBT5749727.1 redoxin family protein [Flavobacteriales bacterium]
MKPKQILTIVLIVAAGIYFVMNTNPNQVTITGKINNPIGESITFSNQDTAYSTIATTNGTFTISFDLDSATYLRFEHGPEGTPMYVYPGDKIKLTIDTELFDETIKYKGSSSSSYLAKKYLLEEENDFFGKVYYMSSAEEYKSYLDSYKNSVSNEFSNITDSTFINNEINGIDKDIEYFIGRQEKLAEYSNDIKAHLWETRAINRDFNFYAALDSLNLSDFQSMTEQYAEAYKSSLNKVNDIEYRITVNKQVAESNIKWLERKFSVDNIPQEGEAAIDFTYPDKDGNEFSLTSFKENLVYVDVWATWCGPCKAEIPSLQKLEADYHEKNITFISVSVDTNKEAWENMVADKELGGIQLWADGWGKITKDYAIFGIPRFLLFDTEGNVISTNAPRPSSSEIREILEANL